MGETFFKGEFKAGEKEKGYLEHLAQRCNYKGEFKQGLPDGLGSLFFERSLKVGAFKKG